MNKITKGFAGELMTLIHEYGAAKQRLHNYSGKEQDLAWKAIEAAHARVLKKIYNKVDFSLGEPLREIVGEE